VIKMGVWAKMLYNNHTFNATTPDTNIPADHVKYLDISLSGLSTGTPTEANWVAGMPGIVVKLGGIRICNMTMDNLQALNALWLGRSPLQKYLGQTADYLVTNPQRLPLYVVKQGRELSAQFEYADMTAVDTEQLDVKYTYRDSPFNERRNLHYAYETFVQDGSASTRVNISRAGARLLGILINDTITPETDQDGGSSPNVSECDVIVDDRVVYSDNWVTRCDEICPHSYDDDAAWGAYNYDFTFISFEEEPWPADHIWLVTRNTALFGEGTAATTSYNTTVIYDEP